MRKRRLHHVLKAARYNRGLSLRDIEHISGNKISNTYISMLERGREHDPSPHKLRVLARILKLDYMDLMERATYITARDLRGEK